MPNSQDPKGLYSLRLNKFRLAYELTDDAIIISTIIQSNISQNQLNNPLKILIDQVLPRIIRDLFKIEPTQSSKNIAGNRMELIITIIPKDQCQNSDSDSVNSDGSEIDNIDNAALKMMHFMLCNHLRKHYGSFDIRWLGSIEPSVEPSPQPSL